MFLGGHLRTGVFTGVKRKTGYNWMGGLYTCCVMLCDFASLGVH